MLVIIWATNIDFACHILSCPVGGSNTVENETFKKAEKELMDGNQQWHLHVHVIT